MGRVLAAVEAALLSVDGTLQHKHKHEHECECIAMGDLLFGDRNKRDRNGLVTYFGWTFERFSLSILCIAAQ